MMGQSLGDLPWLLLGNSFSVMVTPTIPGGQDRQWMMKPRSSRGSRHPISNLGHCAPLFVALADPPEPAVSLYKALVRDSVLWGEESSSACETRMYQCVAVG